jgi:hypothetical protein
LTRKEKSQRKKIRVIYNAPISNQQKSNDTMNGFSDYSQPFFQANIFFIRILKGLGLGITTFF